MAASEPKGINESSIKDRDFLTPEPVYRYTFLQDRVDSVSCLHTSNRNTGTNINDISVKINVYYDISTNAMP